MPESTNENNKVLYLDADSEITEAIEKLKKAKEKEVRIVVPARSSLLHSSVNIKLLKKASRDSDKSLILVTNDKITKNLAGSAGIAIASSVKALAHVPDVAKAEEQIPEKIQISDDRPKEDGESESEGEGEGEGFESKHIDLTDEEPVNPKNAEKAPKKSSKKVPDYGKLNKRIWLAVGAVAAIVIVIILYVVVPTGKVIVSAEAKKTPLNFNFVLDADSTTSSASTQVIAAQKAEVSKDVAFDISATGKKEVGNKATGTLSVKNCDDVSTHNLAAGTGVSGGGKTFVVAQATTIPAGSAGGGVVNCSSAVDVQITATAPGEAFNVGPTTFSIAGFSSLYKATGQTSGGTTKTITVLSADDIANAKKQVEQQASANADELVKKAGNDNQLFRETIQNELVDFKTSVAQDAEADKVNVTTKLKSTAFMAKNSDLDALFDAQIKSELSGNKEVYQNGAKDGKYTVVKQLTPTKVQLNVKTSAYYGDPIDKKAIAREVAGKPKKDVSDLVKKSGEQITGAQVETWPSLLPNMPLLGSKITVDIKVVTD